MNERKISDYLHFYLGCDCRLIEDGEDPKKFRLTVYNLNYYKDYTECITPILRPLSDMTEEEGKEIMKMIYQAIFHLDCELDAIDIIRGDENSFGMKAGESRYEERIGLTIEPHCGIELSVEGGKIMTPQFEATRWLLSKGFDLFGLIDSNLAINKSTLKP